MISNLNDLQQSESDFFTGSQLGINNHQLQRHQHDNHGSRCQNNV
jgi:hypothetical protein